MKLFAIIISISIVVGLSVYAISAGVFADLFEGVERTPVLLPQNIETAENAQMDKPTQVKEKEVSTPSPLRIFQPQPVASSLSGEGVFVWTNFHRQGQQLTFLQRNSVLDAIAQAKVEDMFARQYFEHISPTGEGVSDIAARFNYEFIAIGENLALGNYETDQVLVQAWMDSPGHRANILGSYDEIGIALKRGTFEGNTTWLAVQVFGRPITSCTYPNEELKMLIESNKNELEVMARNLDKKAEELEKHQPKFGPAYNQKVNEYNALVDTYEKFAKELEEDIALYNVQVKSFNACAAR